ncbi:type I toxin-antitoxin system Ibs family toxin, partial [Escherichia coli]|nr:type I toxin-antitoxin system Ibs family toxin [Escherichia coli O45:H2]EFI2917667.1 type I toxin-antitoxin system Ibs family toxin [Escherichia coli]EFP7659080.1 type I toxin-antitoxin system Ibs family toxin [Shigella flexneri]EFJ8341302.1 type I toxin-antitoxin system Ibs family toxin [Escherichia coli]EFM5108085.1 type I toxin-antitoxin system Ibs family toxin [Escherichia coli]
MMKLVIILIVLLLVSFAA